MRTAGLPAVVAAAVLAGCAGSAVPSSGPELLTEVVESLQDTGSVRIEGNTSYGDP